MADPNTKERILEAASRVFCEKGFKATTVRDICAEAEANVAAINYHFGDKLKLYHQVLKLWMEEMMTGADRQQGITDISTIEERLRAYVYGEFRSLCTYDDPEKRGKRKKSVCSLKNMFQKTATRNCSSATMKLTENS